MKLSLSMDAKTLKDKLGDIIPSEPLEITEGNRRGALYYFFRAFTDTPSGVEPYLMVYKDKFGRDENPVNKGYRHLTINLSNISDIRRFRQAIISRILRD